MCVAFTVFFLFHCKIIRTEKVKVDQPRIPSNIDHPDVYLALVHTCLLLVCKAHLVLFCLDLFCLLTLLKPSRV